MKIILNLARQHWQICGFTAYEPLTDLHAYIFVCITTDRATSVVYNNNHILYVNYNNLHITFFCAPFSLFPTIHIFFIIIFVIFFVVELIKKSHNKNATLRYALGASFVSLRTMMGVKK